MSHMHVITFFIFAVIFYVKCNEDNFLNYTKLISDIHRFYKTSGVVFFHPNNEDDFQQTSIIYTIIRKLSKEHIKSIRAAFSDLKIMIDEHETRIGRPLFVSFFIAEESIEQFAHMSSQVHMSYPVWLMIFMPTISKSLQNFCLRPRGNPFNLAFNTETIIMCYNTYKLQQWYSVLEDQTEVYDFATWNYEEGLSLVTSASLYDIRNNMRGKKLRVITVKNSYAATEEQGRFKGFFGLLIGELMTTLNISVQHVLKENNHGFKDDITNSWHGAVGKVISGDADLGIGDFTMTSLRLQYVDFTSPVMVSPDCLYIKEQDSAVLWTAYFKGLHTNIWIMIIIVIFLATISLTLMKNTLLSKDYCLHNTTEIYINIWGIFCQQGLTHIPGVLSMKLAYLSTFITAMIVYDIYSASLISYLTLPKSSLPFSSLAGFVQDGTYKLTVIQRGAGYDFFKASNDTTIQGMMKLMESVSLLPQNYKDGFNQVCLEKVAFHAPQLLHLVVQNDIPCKLTAINTGRLESYAFILQKHSPYTELLNHHIKKFESNGILVYYKNRKKIYRKLSHSAVPDNAIALWEAAPILAILIGGTVLGIIILFLEKLHFYYKNKEKKFVAI